MVADYIIQTGGPRVRDTCFKQKRRHWDLETLNSILWKNRFGKCCGPVERQATHWMSRPNKHNTCQNWNVMGYNIRNVLHVIFSSDKKRVSSALGLPWKLYFMLLILRQRDKKFRELPAVRGSLWEEHYPKHSDRLAYIWNMFVTL